MSLPAVGRASPASTKEPRGHAGGLGGSAALAGATGGGGGGSSGFNVSTATSHPLGDSSGVSPLVKRMQQLYREDPATLPRAGKVDQPDAFARNVHRSKDPMQSRQLHLSPAGASTPTRADWTTVVRDSFVRHPPSAAATKSTGGQSRMKGDPLLGGEVLSGNMCGLGRSVKGITDTASWVSDAHLKQGIAPGSRQSLVAAKQAEWSTGASRPETTTKGWSTEATRARAWTSDAAAVKEACASTLKQRAVKHEERYNLARSGHRPY